MQAKRAYSRKVFAPFLCLLRERVAGQNAALTRTAGRGGAGTREPKPDESRFKQVCCGCGASLPPGKAGRSCEACRAKGRTSALPA